MDHKIILVILAVIHFIGTKRDISDCHIKKVIGIIGLFKSFDLDISVRIKQFCDPAADAIQFHSIKPGLL